MDRQLALHLSRTLPRQPLSSGSARTSPPSSSALRRAISTVVLTISALTWNLLAPFSIHACASFQEVRWPRVHREGAPVRCGGPHGRRAHAAAALASGHRVALLPVQPARDGVLALAALPVLRVVLPLAAPPALALVRQPALCLQVRTFVSFIHSRSLKQRSFILVDSNGPSRRLALLLAIEVSWNVYPSRAWSSALLHVCHACLLVSIYTSLPAALVPTSKKPLASKRAEQSPLPAAAARSRVGPHATAPAGDASTGKLD